jgi:HK97 family phage major capsid protein
MNKLEQLLSDRKAAIDAAKAIVAKADSEKRDLTDEESAEVEKHTAKAAELKAQIEAENARIEKQNALKTALAAEAAWDKQPQARITSPVALGESKPNIVGGEGAAKFGSFGEYLQMVRIGATDPRMAGVLEQKLRAAASGLNTVVDSEGGVLIPPEFAATILQRAYANGAILSRVQRVGLTGNSYKVPYINETTRVDGSRFGGVSGGWVDEGGTTTPSKPSYGQLALNLKKLMCIGYVSEEMMQDYAATGTILEQAFTAELIYRLENAILRGTGAGQPLGVLNSGCLVSVAKETNQTADTIWGPNVVKMQARHWRTNPASTVWLINKDCEPYMPSLTLEGRYGSASTSAEGIPLYYPASPILNAGAYGLLYNTPVVPVEYCSTVGTVGDIVLCDFSQYILVDKGGVEVADSMHVRFLYQENTYRVTYRADGAPTWKTALTPANGSNTLSPFVALDSRD